MMSPICGQPIVMPLITNHINEEQGDLADLCGGCKQGLLGTLRASPSSSHLPMD